tara:strand:- start:729 stop:1904 length:1176 start_codon:yes stop_codon:yes gene_type:complete
MKFGLYVVLAILFSAFMTQILVKDPGYVAIHFQSYVVEMSLIVFIVSSVLIILLLTAIKKMLHSPRLIIKKTRAHKQKKANQLLEKSFLEMAQGKYSKAEKNASKAVKNCSTPVLAYIQAALSADAQKNHAGRDEWIKKAFEKHAYAEDVIFLTQGKLQIRDKRYEDARATLGKMAEKNNDNIAAFELLKDLYVRFGEWEKLSESLPLLRKNSSLSEKEFDELELKIFDKRIDNSSGEEALKTLWKDTPKNLKKNPVLLNAFCLRLINQNLEDISEKEILSYMKRNYSEALIKTYLKINHSDPQKPLKKINQWIENYGNQPELLTSAAKICKKAKLWDQAKDFIEEAINVNPTTENLFILGEILFHFGKINSACETYRKGLNIKLSNESNE